MTATTTAPVTPRTEFPVTRTLHERMWAAQGGAGALLDAVTFTGDRDLPSPYAFTDVAGASIATAGTAVAELLAAAGQPVPAVHVDRVLSSGWFNLPSPPSLPLRPAPSHGGHDFSMFTQLPTADGRWVFVHGVFPSARDRIARALGVADNIEAVAAVVAQSGADEVEERLVNGGAIVAASRTAEEWLASPAGTAVDAEPLVHLTEHAAAGSAWRPTPGRPLAGIKVLDLTRVIAGPTGTRFLASLGAEVLRLERPGSDESLTTLSKGPSHMIGKRWAFLDIASPAGREQFTRLLAEADVLVHGYRPGAIDRLISPEERRAIRPDLVEVTLRAYGWTGPWADRRGFDSVVQFSVGFANAMQEWALQDPSSRVPMWLNGQQVDINGNPIDASRPRHTPVEALDLSTGYQIAAAALRGLTTRMRTGAGTTAKLSLARTANLILHEAHNPEPGPDLFLPLTGPVEDRVYASPSGPSRRLVQPLQVEGTPLFWERPEERPGTSTPTWP